MKKTYAINYTLTVSPAGWASMHHHLSTSVCARFARRHDYLDAFHRQTLRECLHADIEALRAVKGAIASL